MRATVSSSMPWWTKVRSRRSGPSSGTPSAAYLAPTRVSRSGEDARQHAVERQLGGDGDHGVEHVPQALLLVAHSADGTSASRGNRSMSSVAQLLAARSTEVAFGLVHPSPVLRPRSHVRR